MLENIKSKLQEEQVQRALLNGVAAIVVFTTAKVVAAQVGKLAESGIDQLMAKWHPTTETPAE